MKNSKKILVLTIICFGISGCAHNTLKAPCGQNAGLTDPCGNRKPINGNQYAFNPDVLLSMSRHKEAA